LKPKLNLDPKVQFYTNAQINLSLKLGFKSEIRHLSALFKGNKKD